MTNSELEEGVSELVGEEISLSEWILNFECHIEPENQIVPGEADSKSRTDAEIIDKLGRAEMALFRPRISRSEPDISSVQK